MFRELKYASEKHLLGYTVHSVLSFDGYCNFELNIVSVLSFQIYMFRLLSEKNMANIYFFVDLLFLKLLIFKLLIHNTPQNAHNAADCTIFIKNLWGNMP